MDIPTSIKLRIRSDIFPKFVYSDDHYKMSDFWDRWESQYADKPEFNPVMDEFTGQVDPDGVDIYQRDLLQHGENIYIVDKVNDNCNWLGKTVDGKYGMLLSFCGKDKVIGNVHDNPEMI